MQRFAFLSSILLLICSDITAQKQGNIWYFGRNAGVSFNSGVPVALTDGTLNQSEGCASIADANGQLLFYTNGSQVWNRNHIVMPNGSGLLGQNISAQSAIVVPLPQSRNLYYIFTIGDWTNGSAGYGLNYSIVDMSLNNGLGNVTTKNSVLVPSAREQVTAVHHSNCQDVWIITHEKGNTNRFHAFLLTAAGINPSPVISAVGMTYNGGNRYGYLKASHDGKKICSTLGYANTPQTIPTVELYDFDNRTGQLSNTITLALHNAIRDAYASEFSPDNSKLYVVAFSGSFIYQYDISLGTAAAIVASRQNIGIGTGAKACVQLGPDKKIYVSRNGQGWLGVINNPNNAGALCNYVDNGVYLGGRIATLGLPNFNALYFSYPDLGPDSTLCTGLTLPLDASGLGSTSYLWQDGSTSPAFTVTQPGWHWVEVTSTSGCRKRDSVNIQYTSLQVALGNDTVLCDGKNLMLDLTGLSGDSYLWQDGTTNSSYTVSQAGTYTVRVKKGSCDVTDDILVTTGITPMLDLGKDTSICSGNPLHLAVTGAGIQTYTWQDGSTGNNYTVVQAGQYWVHVSNNGCVRADTIQVSFMALPVLELGRDTSLCDGRSFTLNASIPAAASWLWQDGSVAPTYNVSRSGKYKVEVITTCGLVADSVLVKFDNCDCQVKMPNAFTPDGNGRNDLFKPVMEAGCRFTEYRLTIFNRWGEKVFESSNPATGWNGLYRFERAMAGGYPYMLQYRTPGSDVIEKQSGIVMLLR